MARDDITEKIASRIADKVSKANKIIEGQFPMPDRKTWRQMEDTKDLALFDNVRANYGTYRTKQWVLQNKQKDLMEK